jgi:hypothetical protein
MGHGQTAGDNLAGRHVNKDAAALLVGSPAGRVIGFAEGVEPGKSVAKKQPVIRMFSMKIESNITEYTTDIANLLNDINAKRNEYSAALTPQDKARILSERESLVHKRDLKIKELNNLRTRIRADETSPGSFWLESPLDGTVLNWGFQETLTNKEVKASEPLLRIGDKDLPWEIEIKIPQKHIGQVLQAFRSNDPDAELDVDLLLSSAPTQTYKGRLKRSKISGEASPNRDDPNEADPVVLASVRIDGDKIAPENRLPRNLLVTGTEVHTRIRCGKRPMGYSLFYGLWEFFFEKVVFFF